MCLEDTKLNLHWYFSFENLNRCLWKQRKTLSVSLSSIRSVISDKTQKPLREMLTRRGQEKTNVKRET